jgi:iron-sulfur cluster assembly accessory protein
MSTVTEQPIETASSAPATRPFRLTGNAVAQVKKIIQAQGWDGYFLAVRVVPSGCNGLGYDLNLVKEAKAGDLHWEQDGVKIATDALSAEYVRGTEVDYSSSLQGAGFKFQNPNAKSSCGCGQTFSA